MHANHACDLPRCSGLLAQRVGPGPRPSSDSSCSRILQLARTRYAVLFDQELCAKLGEVGDSRRTSFSYAECLNAEDASMSFPQPKWLALLSRS